METVKDRLKHFIKTLGMSVNAFEKKWGTGQSYVNNISKGIGNEHLTNLCNLYPELNLNWLFTGKGSMLLSESENLNENKSNLSKQKDVEERLFSTKEVKLILNKQREAMTEEFGKMLMDNMTHIIDGQLELLKMQVKTQSETIKGQQDSIDKVLNKITGVEEKAGEIVKMVKKIG